MNLRKNLKNILFILCQQRKKKVFKQLQNKNFLSLYWKFKD